MVERLARFKVWRPEKAHSAPRLEFRGSAHDRGYDAKWGRLSEAYRRKNPFCEECERWGDDAVAADLVDHILPVRDFPLSRLSWGNLQSLCSHCHGIKGQMEAFARDRGKLRDLPSWVKNPEQRPRQFQRPR